MAMNTPIGNITQITPISSFVTLQSVALDQYLLGINNFVQGDGSKVTLQNLIASMVNTTNDKNILGLDENGRLQAIEAVNPFGNDNGWAIAPTLTVNWTNRTVSGTGGKAYKDGFEITALNDFTSPAFPSEVGAYYLYYNGTNLVWQSGSKPDSKYLIAKISVDSNDIKMAADAWGVGGVNETISNFLNAALGTIVLNGGEIGNVTTDVEITEGNYLQPTLTATTVGMADFSKLISALSSGSYTRVHTANNQLVYDTAQSGIVPTHSGNIPIIIDNAGNENEIALECCTNVWVVGLPLFGEDPANLHYQFVTGSVQYEGTNDAKAASPMAEIAMQYIDNQYDRYAIIARFTIQRTENGYMCVDYENYNPLQGGGGAGSTGITEVVSDSKYFDGLGLPSSPLTMSEETKDVLNNVIHDKENIYKVIEGHKSHDGKIWDLIEFHDATDKDNLILGNDDRFTSNTSDADFHFALLDSIAGKNQPDATNKLNVYKLFNKTHFDTQADPIYVQDGTIVISCRKKMRISRIEIRAYDTYYVVPQTHICGLNLAEPLVRDITLSDFANAHYFGGQSITKEADYNVPTATRWGLNRPAYYNMNEKDYYNVFFICFDHWCSGENGSNRRYAGIKIYGSVEETEDGDLTPKSDKLLQVLGDYDVKMSGKGFNKSAFIISDSPTDLIVSREGVATFTNRSGATNKTIKSNIDSSMFDDLDLENDTITWEFAAKQENADNPNPRLVSFYQNISEQRPFIGQDGDRFYLYLTNKNSDNYNIPSPVLTLLNAYYFHSVTFNFKEKFMRWIIKDENNNIVNNLLNTSPLLFDLTNLQTLFKKDNIGGLGFAAITNVVGRPLLGNFYLKTFKLIHNNKTIFDGGIDYEDCKWISSNGTVYNTKDLIEQYGEIPQERVELDRWISCFGHRYEYSLTTKAVDNYYPCLVDGVMSNVGTIYNLFNCCRQTDYMPEPRVDVGYVLGGIDTEYALTLGSTHVWQYAAKDSFPAGEYFAEVRFGYNNIGLGNTNTADQYTVNRFMVQCLDENENIVYKQSFGCEGSMYDRIPLYRTPRFYVPIPFKYYRIISLDAYFPNTVVILSQTQLYYRDINKSNDLSFVPSPTEYDLSANMVRHVTNAHFFITPTGVRVGSNCFVRQIDPLPEYACVGNRWINEDTELSYVCNESGVWEREDFCELACMMLWGSEHKGMFKRRVSNEENPITHYVQDYGNLGGQLCFDDEILPNRLQTFQTDPDDPDFYFVAEAKDENEGIRFYYPSGHTCLQAFRRSLVKSKIYESGEQFAHWSNNDNVGVRMIAYKTFETEAAGEYIESEDIS